MWRSIDRWLTGFETACLAAGTAVATLVATAQVLLRYFGGTGLFWAEEFVVYVLIWTAFIAAGAAVRGNDHLSVELLQVALAPRYQRALHRIVAVIGLLSGAALLVYSIEFVETVYDYEQLSPALQWPMWIVYLALPLCGVLLCLRFTQQIFAPTPATHDETAVKDLL
ncbi:MAG: TRAP transporter small permease [Pseudolabrys sp.]